MSSRRIQFTIGHLMLAVAASALLFVWQDVRAAFGLFVLGLVVIIPAAIAPPGRRLEAASWACSLQPAVVLSYLYATWVTAWCVLGHCPRPSLDDPKYISPVVEVPFVMFAVSLFYGWIDLCLHRFLADGGLLCPSLESSPSRGPPTRVAGGLHRADVGPARCAQLVHGLSRCCGKLSTIAGACTETPAVVGSGEG